MLECLKVSSKRWIIRVYFIKKVSLNNNNIGESRLSADIYVDSDENNETLFFYNTNLSILDNETIAESLAFAISVESAENALEMEPDGYAIPLFNEWLHRAGRLPYSKELNYFVYDYLPEFDLNAVVNELGEETVKELALLPFSNDGQNYDQTLEKKLAEFVSKLKENKKEGIKKLEYVVELLEEKSGNRAKALAAVFAHILNKSINNTYISSSDF